jgi:hypothetical protein
MAGIYGDELGLVREKVTEYLGANSPQRHAAACRFCLETNLVTRPRACRQPSAE